MDPSYQIALVDCNAFYVSCERLFNPRLRGRAVVVLSNNDGCVVSRSREAKAIPVAMGVPYFQLRDLVDSGRLVACSSNYALYGDLSHRVMTTLAEFSVHQEIYSIDECFLDLTVDGAAAERSMVDARSRVRHDVGIETSIGIGPTKTLAKLGSDLAKNSASGVFVMPPPGPGLAEVLGRVPVADVWGVGPAISRTLAAWGVMTALDLARCSTTQVQAVHGVVGARIVQELRGTRCHAMQTQPTPRKTITVSRSFSADVVEVTALRAALTEFAEQAAVKLRANHLVASTIRTWVEANRYKLDAPDCSGASETTFAIPTDLTPELIAAVAIAVQRLWRRGGAWKKAGVLLQGLSPAAARQESFLDTCDRPRVRSLMGALDALNERHGRACIGYGTKRLSQRWRPLADRCSPRYTTRWDELPTVA